MSPNSFAEAASGVSSSLPARAPAPKGMVEQVDARKNKNEILSLYERSGRPDMTQRFDWYYRNGGQEAPLSWGLRSRSGELCGLCSVSPRWLRYGQTTLRAGVAGNLLVDRGKGLYLDALSLVRAMKSAVTTGDIDILLGSPNHLSEPSFIRLNFTVIDRWTSHAWIHRSGGLLQAHFGWPGRIASPIVDFCAATHRFFSSTKNDERHGLRFFPIPEDRLDALSPEQWAPPEKQFTNYPSTDYLFWRFLRDPVNLCSISAIVSPSGKPCGYLAFRHDPHRLWIIDCNTDSREISQRTAITQFCLSKEARRKTIWIAHLSSAEWSSQLTSCGFIRVTQSVGGFPHVPLVGFWLPEHPLAGAFAQANAWSIFTGANDV